MSKILPRLCAFLPVCGAAIALSGPASAREPDSNIPWANGGPPSFSRLPASSDPSMVKSTNFLTSSYVFSLAWSPDGETLAVGLKGSLVFYSARGQVLKTYSTRSSAPQSEAPAEKQSEATENQKVASYAVTGLWWSPDGKSLAARVDGGGIQVWNTETDQVRLTLGDHKGGTLCLAWSPKSDTIATGGVDTLITLFDASTGKLNKTLDSHSFPVRQLAFGKQDDEIVSLGIRKQHGPQNTEIKHWSIIKGQPTNEIMQDYGCTFSALSPQGDLCSLVPDLSPTRKNPNGILLCDTTTGQTTRTPYMPPARSGAVHLFSPSGGTFTACFYEGGIYRPGTNLISLIKGSQTYLTKGAEPLMGSYQETHSSVSPSDLPAGAATMSKKGMLATSIGKTIEIWAPPFG